SRDEALRRMDRALCEFIVEGIETTISLHQTLINDPKFIEGDYDTTFIENRKIIK
nr:acetyl-CoA carboxylase biotin carboxylase subunit [bacterium]